MTGESQRPRGKGEVMITGKTLEACGRLLFGHSWRAAFEDAFDLSNRSLRRMIDGAVPVPPGLAIEMEIALRDHLTKGDELLMILSVDEVEEAS